MKRTILRCAAGLLIAAALLPTALAAEPFPAVTEVQVCYPTSITRSEDGTEIRKVYDLSPEQDPAGIPRSDFEQDGFHYTLTDLLQQELPEHESRPHTETVSLESKSKDMESVLALLPQEKEFVTEVVDVSGCLLFPGFIDAHTHFDLHVAGTVTADDFETGTRAAVRGGTTTIVDFGTQYPGETLADGLKNWHEKADGKCSCDYGFHMSITDWNPSVSREIDDMMEQGVSSFKLYMTYDTQVDDETIFAILRRLKEAGGITGVHCENSGMIAALQAEAKAAGRMGVSSHPATRPAAAEAEAIGIAVGGEVYNLPGGTAIPDAPEALAQEGEAEEYVFRNHARIIENEEATNAAFVAMEEAMCDMDSSSEERLTAVEEALCELDSAANGGGEN